MAAVGDLSAAISTSISDPATRLQDEFTGLALDWGSAGDVALLAGVEGECGEAVSEGKELVEECVDGADRIFSIVREVAGFSSDSERVLPAGNAWRYAAASCVMPSVEKPPDSIG